MIDKLYDIKMALDAEIAELQTYRGLISDDIMNIEIDAEIKGIRKAQGYLHRAIQDQLFSKPEN